MVSKVEATSITSEGMKQAVQDVTGETISATVNHKISCAQNRNGGC